ncbi:hypothetical protein ACTJ3V_001882, partial [Salmonella enterica subsp. enterica serovar Anatum]
HQQAYPHQGKQYNCANDQTHYYLFSFLVRIRVACTLIETSESFLKTYNAATVTPGLSNS